MIEVGDTLRNSREVSGVTLEEVSTDLDIPVLFLEQIEDGNIEGLYEKITDICKFCIGLVSKFPEKIRDKFKIFII